MPIIPPDRKNVVDDYKCPARSYGPFDNLVHAISSPLLRSHQKGERLQPFQVPDDDDDLLSGMAHNQEEIGRNRSPSDIPYHFVVLFALQHCRVVER